MMSYLLQRILLFIPSLLILSIVIFAISILSPGDPSLSPSIESNKSDQLSFAQREKQLSNVRESMGLNQAFFYFSVNKKTSSDTIYIINNQTIKESISNWSYQLGSWDKADKLFGIIKSELRHEIDPERINTYQNALYTKDIDQAIQIIERADKQLISHSFKADLEERNSLNNFIPVISWNGLNNRYHHWISGIIQFDFGNSLIDKQAVAPRIKKALSWTISLSLISLLLSLLIALPLAVKAASNPDGLLDKICSTLFFSLYSIPVFWMASLLLIYFASVENFYWFPAYGVGEITSDMGLAEIITLRTSHLTLPMFCWTYGSIAFLYRQIRSKMINSLSQDYILTAKAKGLSKSRIAWKHAFVNSSFPLITILGAAFPALIGGSFVIESVFSIPGMGKLTIDAFMQRDYPLIINLSMLASIFTIIGVFLADLAYHYLDPRIKYQQSRA